MPRTRFEEQEAAATDLCAHGPGYTNLEGQQVVEKKSLSEVPDPVSLRAYPSERIAGRTHAEIQSLARQNALAISNEQVVAIAKYNLADAIRAALAPLAAGEARAIHDEDSQVVGAALRGVASKMTERITGFGGTPSSFYEILAPDLDLILSAAEKQLAGEQSESAEPADTVSGLDFIGGIILSALDEAAPLFLLLEEIPFHEAHNFVLDFSKARRRHAHFGEILPHLSVACGRPHFGQPRPVDEGTPVLEFLGQQFAISPEQEEEIHHAFERLIVSGQVMPNIYQKKIVYPNHRGDFVLIVRDCWIVKVQQMVMFIPKMMGESLMTHAEIS